MARCTGPYEAVGIVSAAMLQRFPALPEGGLSGKRTRAGFAGRPVRAEANPRSP